MGVLSLTKVKAVIFEVPVTLTLSNGSQLTWPASLPVSIAGKEVTIAEANVRCVIMDQPIGSAGEILQVFRIDRVETVA